MMLIYEHHTTFISIGGHVRWLLSSCQIARRRRDVHHIAGIERVGAGFFAPDTASQGVVTGRQVEEQPRSRVGEVLELVPGLIVTQHSGEGKANQYFLRGFNLDHGTDIDITLADMPVNMRTHAHGQGYADLNFMIPELISTMQYSKGPYFPDLGDFDTAGAVQINYVNTLPHDLALVTAGTLGYYRGLGAMSRPVEAKIGSNGRTNSGA